MSIRVIGGKAKGLPLFIPSESITRPTSALLKRRPFDFRQDWREWIFIDLCAGSGAMGIEAWSRGAKEVFLIENHPKVISILSQNLSLIKQKYLEDFQVFPIKLLKVKAQNWIDGWDQFYSNLSKEEQKKVCIFFDPPYENHNLYKEIVYSHLFKDWFFGEIWIESDNTKGIPLIDWPPVFGSWVLEKKYEQGTSFIVVYRRSE